MQIKTILSPLFGLCAVAIALIWPMNSTASAPELSSTVSNANQINLTVSNLTTKATYYIEHADNLTSNDWKEVHHFEGQTGSTNWTATAAASSGYYRAVKDPYHSKVGQSTELSSLAYSVSGTVEIINNRTIKISNFNYTGGGVVVQIVVAADSSYAPYVALTEDIFGQSFVNETLYLTIPSGTDLDAINYISVWCVAFGADFGSGYFN